MIETPNLLLATLGASWAVVPEVAAAMAPSKCKLYDLHPAQAQLAEIRKECGLNAQDEITQLWIITSSSHRTLQGVENIKAWNATLSIPLVLRFFIASETDDVATSEELAILRELIFRVVLLANETGNTICSLAGGRKTMSADLQRAASLFGCSGLLHIVAPEPLPDILKNNEPSFWNQPLPADDAEKLLPAFIGRYTRCEAFDAATETTQLKTSNFPLPESIQQMCNFQQDAVNLVKTSERMEENAQTLLVNYLASIASHDQHENWRHLYRLSPIDIDKLRQTQLNTEHLSFIQMLPKAELHCHLGGLPNLTQQIQIGHGIWQSLNNEVKRQKLDKIAPLLENTEWPWSWPDQYLRTQEISHIEKAEIAAAILVNCSEATLFHNLYTVTEPRVGLKNKQRGFAAYERPGELMGSATLGHPQAIDLYIDAIKEYVKQENICYLELRGSPHKYATDPIHWLKYFEQQLKDEICQFRFIWIIDRRQNNAATIVNQAVEYRGNNENPFLVGLDLAGDEGVNSAAQLAESFKPAFHNCLPITIHAGEGEPAKKIWQASYLLHADRIGHGLSLADQPPLLQRFRDRRICLELCPTSNREVIGYFDPNHIESKNYAQYPLNKLWRSGVAMTINTDNPGISRTTLSKEYICAARMSEDGLSMWDTLAMIKQSFTHAMSCTETREKLLKKCDQTIFTIVHRWLNGELK
jgi:adenosine deaminase